MDRSELVALLHKGVVEVKFFKRSDGSTRNMKCTLHGSLMPPAPPKDPLKASRPLPAHLILVWDVEKDALRSFALDDLIENPVLVKDLGPEDAV